jgi:transcriptional regulator with XRE-family HTH domain
VVDGPVTGRAGLRFGGLLRQLRDQAGLTQDELAEAAQVSQRAVSDLERGINATARKDTAVLLAGALGLDGPARELFVAAARGRAPADKALAAAAREAGAGSAAAASRTLPRDIAAFTGRQAELGQLEARWAEAAAGGGVPWKASAAATSRTARPAKAPPACSRPWRSTSASDLPAPAACSKPSATIMPGKTA